MTGSVILAGAGCGAYDLITLRGLRALRQCTAVVYDALIDARLLDEVPEDAVRICVGKRAGAHSAQQEEIHTILISLAQEGHTVVRLKGGDPFVFGRGGEEITALQKQHIPYTVIPGISSCIAVPELAGIPVTHRQVSRGFHVITAHHAQGTADFRRYAGLEGTLVFLMGLRMLPLIAGGLQEGGMDGATPAAVVSDGASTRQQIVRSTLSRIAEDASGLPAPAVVIVGETAGYDFAPTVHMPLEGIRVTVAGTAEFTGRVSDLLTAGGAIVQRVPHIRIVQPSPLPALEGWDHIVLTSRNGAALFIQQLRENHVDLRSLHQSKFAVIGSGTAAVLEEAGIYPELIPPVFTSEALAESIVGSVKPGERVLLLRAENGSEALPRILAELGITYRDEVLYRTDADLSAVPASVESDYLVFGSASGAAQFFRSGVSVSPATRLVCIGTRTAQTAMQLTKRPVLTALPHTAKGIFEKIKEDYHA